MQDKVYQVYQNIPFFKNNNNKSLVKRGKKIYQFGMMGLVSLG